MNKVIDSVGKTLDTIDDISPEVREKVIGAVVDSVAPKGWLKSSTVRWGVISIVSGVVGLAISYYTPNPELITGSIMGIITGIGAVRGRVKAEQPVNVKKVL